MSRLSFSVVLLFVGVSPLFAAAPPVVIDATSIAVLVRKLDSENFFTRQRADQALRQLGKSVVPRLLIERSQTVSVEVRWRLGRIIETLTLDERLEDMVRLLGDSDKHLRQRAQQALRQAGPAALPLLRRELRPDMPAEQRRQLEQVITELTRNH